MLDLIIIGGGPAGYSAAMTARMRNLDVLLVRSGAGALEKARRVDNYPGLPAVTGEALLRAFREQAHALGAGEREGVVQKVLPVGGAFSVLAGGELLECRSVILAMGLGKTPALRGETEWLGRGVSYCATCDGMFYKGKTVAVVGADEKSVEEANFLATLAGHVYYAVEKKHDTAALAPGIEVIGKPRAVLGGTQVTALETDRGETRVDGVFILRGAIAPALLMDGLDIRDGAVSVDRAMRTGVPGAFAAGDITGAPYQAAKAAGEGNIAALSAAEYLAKQ